MITSKRLNLIMLGLLGFCVLVFIAIYSIGLSNLGNKSQQVVGLKLQSRVTDDRLSSLAQAKKEVEKYSYFKAVAKTVIPSDKDQAQAVLDIFQLASQSGIAIANITFPASNLGTSSIAPTATGASALSASSKSLLSQAKAVEGINGLYSVELTITPATGKDVPVDSQATYPKLLDFLDRVERNRRTAQVSQISVQPIAVNGAPTNFINFSLVINIFIKP